MTERKKGQGCQVKINSKCDMDLQEKVRSFYHKKMSYRIYEEWKISLVFLSLRNIHIMVKGYVSFTKIRKKTCLFQVLL